MEIKLFQFSKDNKLSIDGDIDFSNVKKPIPQIDKIISCHVLVKGNKYDDLVVLDISINAMIDAVSSYTNKIDKYPLNIKETLNLSLIEQEDNEYDVIKGNTINLDEYVYSLILASMPITVIFKGESLPNSINGVEIISEEEYNSRKKKESSPFDILDSLFEEDK